MCGSNEDRKIFISKMEPIVDEFYSKNPDTIKIKKY